MQQTAELREISYHEYRVIAHLLRAHRDELQGRLRGMVAFGDLLTRDEAFDIDLLEVVEGWEEPRFGRFTRQEDLPLRGELRLYFLTPEELMNPAAIEAPEERKWVEDLLDRVRQGFEIIMESPPGWLRQVLERTRPHPTLTAPPSGSVDFTDPARLLKKDM